jgi:hypothetical protein
VRRPRRGPDDWTYERYRAPNVRRRWTVADDLAVLRGGEGRQPNKELATKLGRTYWAIIRRRYWLRQLERAD